jgi:hypothetical protein
VQNRYLLPIIADFTWLVTGMSTLVSCCCKSVI